MQYLLESRISQVKSGKQVWRIRQCGLMLTSQVLQTHRMEGYDELCTAVCSALIEFNILLRDEDKELNYHARLHKFEEYWEKTKVYKLG